VATLANVTHRDPDILSGSLVFVGTRVPVCFLFDYLEGGESLEVTTPRPPPTVS
jgi:uncharacterized protein (DUF433 family)